MGCSDPWRGSQVFALLPSVCSSCENQREKIVSSWAIRKSRVRSNIIEWRIMSRRAKENAFVCQSSLTTVTEKEEKNKKQKTYLRGSPWNFSHRRICVAVDRHGDGLIASSSYRRRVLLRNCSDRTERLSRECVMKCIACQQSLSPLCVRLTDDCPMHDWLNAVFTFSGQTEEVFCRGDVTTSLIE